MGASRRNVILAACLLPFLHGCLTSDVYRSWEQTTAQPDAVRARSLTLPDPEIEWSAWRTNANFERMFARLWGRPRLHLAPGECAGAREIRLFAVDGTPILYDDISEPEDAGNMGRDGNLRDIPQETVFHRVSPGPCSGVVFTAWSRDPRTVHLIIRSSSGEDWMHERIVQSVGPPWHAWPRIVAMGLVELPFLPLELCVKGIALAERAFE